MAGLNVVVADRHADAQIEFATLQRMFLDLRAGRSRKIQPPVDPACRRRDRPTDLSSTTFSALR
ncbi:MULTISPECIES: hypothetical protein [Dietzia]|uniref:hypothetical protein n=1 Tax=Dietzia sp. KRD202 TaxID=2729732 RepID=UPI001F49533E|nr:hypothetical protein [Dietzia sp. KRD202]